MKRAEQGRRVALPRLLVVDDDAFVLQLLRRMLQQMGVLQVMTCTSAAAAIEQVKDKGPDIDVVVLDINMPDVDGIEFVRRLAEMRYAGGVILVSAEGRRMIETIEQLVLSRGLRLLGSLPKPPEARAFRRLLRESMALPVARTAARRPSVQELLQALEAEELFNMYQPQVDLRSGECRGVESLVRWRTRDGDLMGPELFIPLAEDNRLVDRITHRVLRLAARQAREWQLAGLGLQVSVNVSMQDLTALDFPDIAEGIVTAAGVDPRRVTLEVTESRMMEQRQNALDVIGRLKLKRFHLSIDDFGTGHSSLSQLKDMPFDELKIDRSFVHGAATDDTRRAICSATLRMSAQLGMEVVAEGIETPEDLETLVRLGCQCGQGYLFSQPLAPTEATAWLKRRAASQRRPGETGP
jgi:EAL domain-containing protein (putative c-di-GMP-specific phosphodiesterase class I)/ActR/RegA family two-component response regulator